MARKPTSTVSIDLDRVEEKTNWLYDAEVWMSVRQEPQIASSRPHIPFPLLPAGRAPSQMVTQLKQAIGEASSTVALVRPSFLVEPNGDDDSPSGLEAS